MSRVQGFRNQSGGYSIDSIDSETGDVRPKQEQVQVENKHINVPNPNTMKNRGSIDDIQSFDSTFNENQNAPPQNSPNQAQFHGSKFAQHVNDDDVQSIVSNDAGDVGQVQQRQQPQQVNRQRVQNDAEQQLQQAHDKSLQGLRNSQVRSTTGKGAVGADITAAAGVAIGGGILIGIGKGALIGTGVGALGGPFGAIGGAIIGGLIGGLAAAGIGGGIGWGIGKLKARNITADSLQKDYGAGSKQFNNLMERYNKQVRKNNTGPGIPLPLSEHDAAQLNANFRNILKARLAEGRPITKQFLDNAVIKLAKLQTDTTLSPDQKTRFGANVSALMIKRAEAKLPVDLQAIDEAISNDKACDKLGVEDDARIDEQRAGKIKNTLQTIVAEQRSQGRNVPPKQLAQIRDALTEIGANQKMSPQQKDVISDQLCKTIVPSINGRSFEKVILGTVSAMKKVGEANIPDQQKAAAYHEIAFLTKSAIKDGIPLSAGSGAALAGGLLTIAQSNLGAAAATEARKNFTQTMDLQLGNRLPIETDFANQTAAALVTAQQKLAQLNNDNRFDADDKKAIAKTFNNLVKNRIVGGQDASADVQQTLLDQLTTDMAAAKGLTFSDDEVIGLKQNANDAADQLLDTLLDENASEQDIMNALHKGLATSRTHCMARVIAGLNDDNSPNVRSNGERRLGGALANDDYAESFANRLEDAMARKNLSKQQAQQLYDKLMKPGGPVRSLLFAFHVANNDERLMNEVDQSLSLGLTNLAGMGLRTMLGVLTNPQHANMADQMKADTARLKTISDEAFSSESKVNAVLDREISADILNGPDRRKLRQTRAKVHQELANLGDKAFWNAKNYRFDLRDDDTTTSPAVFDSAGVKGDELVRGKTALLNTAAKMTSTADSIDHTMKKREARLQREARERLENNNNIQPQNQNVQNQNV